MYDLGLGRVGGRVKQSREGTPQPRLEREQESGGASRSGGKGEPLSGPFSRGVPGGAPLGRRRVGGAAPGHWTGPTPAAQGPAGPPTPAPLAPSLQSPLRAMEKRRGGRRAGSGASLPPPRAPQPGQPAAGGPYLVRHGFARGLRRQPRSVARLLSLPLGSTTQARRAGFPVR